MKMTMFMLESQIAAWGQKSIAPLSLIIQRGLKDGFCHFGLVSAAQVEPQEQKQEKQGHVSSCRG